MFFKYQILFIFSTLSKTVVQCDQHTEDIEIYRQYGGSLDLQDAFDVFYSEPFKSMQKIEELIHTLNCYCPNITSFFPRMVQYKKHVFIAVEGTHRETKLIITKMLARKLRGKFKFSPPYFMVNTGQKYTDTRTMSRAYYCLGYYATAYDIAQQLPYLPIVSGGYWLDQLAFGVVASFSDRMPSIGSPLYTWPRDLLMPDVIFFLNLPSHNFKNTFTATSSLSFRSRLVQFYRNWGGHPPVVEVNSTNVHRDVISILSHYIEDKLGYVAHLESTLPPIVRQRRPDMVYW